MFKLVFNEEPDLVINPVDSSLVVDDDIDQFILKD